MTQTEKSRWRAVKAENIKTVVADEEWQALRESFVGTWKVPGKADQNLILLDEYARPFCNPWRVRRVLNYLTGSGFRTGQIPDSFSAATMARFLILLYEVRHHWNQMTEK